MIYILRGKLQLSKKKKNALMQAAHIQIMLQKNRVFLIFIASPQQLTELQVRKKYQIDFSKM